MNENQPKLASSASDIEARIKNSLDASSKQIDHQTQHRLQSIRKLALNHLPINNSKKGTWQLLGNKLIAHWQPSLAGLVLFSGMLLLFLIPNHQHILSTGNASIQPTNIIDFLDSPDDLDVLADPGFYLWVNGLDNEKASARAN